MSNTCPECGSCDITTTERDSDYYTHCGSCGYSKTVRRMLTKTVAVGMMAGGAAGGPPGVFVGAAVGFVADWFFRKRGEWPPS